MLLWLLKSNLDHRTSLGNWGLDIQDLNGTSNSSLAFAHVSTSQGNLDPALLPLHFLIYWDLIMRKLIERSLRLYTCIRLQVDPQLDISLVDSLPIRPEVAYPESILHLDSLLSRHRCTAHFLHQLLLSCLCKHFPGHPGHHLVTSHTDETTTLGLIEPIGVKFNELWMDTAQILSGFEEGWHVVCIEIVVKPLDPEAEGAIQVIERQRKQVPNYLNYCFRSCRVY